MYPVGDGPSAKRQGMGATCAIFSEVITGNISPSKNKLFAFPSLVKLIEEAGVLLQLCSNRFYNISPRNAGRSVMVKMTD